jgi:hypothetical protein
VVVDVLVAGVVLNRALGGPPSVDQAEGSARGTSAVFGVALSVNAAVVENRVNLWSEA